MSSPTEPAPLPPAPNPPATPAETAEIPLSEALILGALHGPAELLPISSSGHIAVIPWLLDWDYCDVDAELRKAFEVALHAGTAAALLITLRTEVSDAMRGMSLRIANSLLRSPSLSRAAGRDVWLQIESVQLLEWQRTLP